jgi:predicted transcriptional regulator
VHATFDTPGRMVTQVIELPDGSRYFSIAQMVRRPAAPWPQPQPRFAIGLGCEIRHAHKLVYASGLDLEKAQGTPIGVNCRLCERENCSQRAEPPLTRTLIFDEYTRRVSSFSFSNAREL